MDANGFYEKYFDLWLSMGLWLIFLVAAGVFVWAFLRRLGREE